MKQKSQGWSRADVSLIISIFTLLLFALQSMIMFNSVNKPLEAVRYERLINACENLSENLLQLSSDLNIFEQYQMIYLEAQERGMIKLNRDGSSGRIKKLYEEHITKIQEKIQNSRELIARLT